MKNSFGGILAAESVQCPSQYTSGSRVKNIARMTARMAALDRLAEILYGTSCIFGRRFEQYVEAYAKSTPRPDDVFLHSLCANRVSEVVCILTKQNIANMR
jgi:hypothetical protein